MAAKREQQFSGLGTMPPKPEGEQFVLDRPLQGGSKTYTAVPFGMAMEVTWEMWRDDMYGLMQEMAAEMNRRGIFVVGFTYPVVPRGQARIRVQLSAAHTDEQIDRAVSTFAEVGSSLGIIG